MGDGVIGVIMENRRRLVLAVSPSLRLTPTAERRTITRSPLTSAPAHASRSSRIQGVSAPMVVGAPWPGITVVVAGSSAARRRIVSLVTA